MTHPARYCPSKAQKPIRGSLLNRSHPLARGLVGCWLLNELTGKIIFNSLDRTSSLAWTETITWDGQGLNCDGVSCQITVATTAFQGIGSGPYTLFSRINMRSSPSEVSGIMAFDDVAPGWHIRTDLGLEGYHDGFFAAGTTYLTADEWGTGCWRRRSTASNGGDYFVNGVFSNTFTHSSSLPNPTTIRLFGYGYENESFKGTCEFVFFWNRALTASEISWLHREPYCMF